MRYVLAYITCLFLVVIAVWVTGLTDFQIYGYDASDSGQRLGFWVLFQSPIGLPLLVGIPVTIVIDLMCWAANTARITSSPRTR